MKVNIYSKKILLIVFIVDILFLLFVGFGLGYYGQDYPFPFYLNWFWYALIVGIIVEFSFMKLFNLEFVEKKSSKK